MDSKTQSIIVEPGKHSATTRVEKNIQTQTKDIYLTQLQQKDTQTQTKNVNPFYQYFPKFYKSELKRSKITLIIWSIFSFLVLAGIVSLVAILLSGPKNDNLWLLVLYVIPLLILFPMYIIKLFTFISFNNEAKTINFKDQKTLSNNIVRIYKKLKVANINANWFGALTYVLCILTFLILIIVAWAVGSYNSAEGMKEFSWNALFSSFATNPLSIILKPADGQLVYFLVFISILVVFFTAAIAQIYTITTSFIRISKIEAFYNSFIVAPDEITALKKSTNRRDMIIFCLVTVIVGLIVYAIYKRVSQSKKQTVIVKG